MKEQFVIPEPYKTWCNLCNQGFMSIDELTAHNKSKIVNHQTKNERNKKGDLNNVSVIRRENGPILERSR